MPLLEEIGTLRRRLADERGAVLLNTPAQTVVPDNLQPAGYRLELEQRHAIEDWNAEISLLTGMAAARDDDRRRVGAAAHDDRRSTTTGWPACGAPRPRCTYRGPTT